MGDFDDVLSIRSAFHRLETLIEITSDEPGKGIPITGTIKYEGHSTKDVNENTDAERLTSSQSTAR